MCVSSYFQSSCRDSQPRLGPGARLSCVCDVRPRLCIKVAARSHRRNSPVATRSARSAPWPRFCEIAATQLPSHARTQLWGHSCALVVPVTDGRDFAPKLWVLVTGTTLQWWPGVRCAPCGEVHAVALHPPGTFTYGHHFDPKSYPKHTGATVVSCERVAPVRTGRDLGVVPI